MWVTFPMMDLNLGMEEDMCGFLPEDIEKSESLEQRGRKRSRSHEVIETSQQHENENDFEQIADRIFAETKFDARSRSPVGSSCAAAKSRWREPRPRDTNNPLNKHATCTSV